MNVFFVRHGETDFNKERKLQGKKIDASLNDTGWKQANQVAGFFEGQPVDVIVASSLVRTQQTSVPLLKSHIHFEKHEELDEMSYGDLEGKIFNEVREEILVIQKEWSSGNLNYRVQGGETPLEVLERASKRVFQILKEHDEKTIVFILHGRLIRILLSEWLGYGLKNMHKIEHANGSINHLKWNGSSFEAVFLNKTDHLVSNNS